ncbi:aminotransferase class I/II-fold pyridoxal phosphate-dependent enzyme (plasmid) [Burkholderia multivorans]|uniref:aminotransferase class I/II-fold pyridoxal phosphate-dependent enzyme n=1 Tax=Burkholderia multivorans TaxID=87883 RepID=UPI00201A049A|nr:aminotransferase class I/II-fold pyridoxal phosphate-dependent enzyme [Burkholderia multivorans]MCO1459896.1 aminotransferase class I/II-fold pyridoxal phosphate-dependent enzyme [Burkholderia multivorans]UQO21307.1 aminotransferase class I/II-fold pyridoxal phosphate-dependent enzyme [Burkholderia multivorans]
MKQVIDAQWLANLVESPRTDGIVACLSQLISSGNLGPGAQLPTVRDLAQKMSVSPSTVMNAWQKLRAHGLIQTRRRGGTVVRYEAVAPSESLRVVAKGKPQDPISPVSWSTTDFSRGTADPVLQPDLGRALAAGLHVANLHETEQEGIVDALVAAVAPTWPITPQAWTTAGGGTEGMLLALEAATHPGDKVAIENPTSPRLLGLLSTLGLTPLAVACDDEGPLPAALGDALREGPAAFVYQLRAHMPVGHMLSERRRDELAALLDRHPDVRVLEDDHLGSVTSTPAHSMGIRLPDRCLLVRAYCRAFGIDLRTSVIGGSRALIERIDEYRTNRVAMTSRILQGALAFLLTDPDSIATLEHARQCYANRRHLLASGLRAHGLEVPDGSGLILWVKVPNESRAIVNLATHGMIVAGGTQCFVDKRSDPHIRISISRLPDDATTIERLAQTIASAIARPSREEYD